MEDRRDCLRTFTGKLVDPFHIEPGDIDIADIAHSLAMQARANGHFPIFYSVAQHSLNCALEAQKRELSWRVMLACLLHDASEAYIADIPRPVKSRLNGFAEIEEMVSQKICEAFGLADLTAKEKRFVRQIDDAMLYHEFLAIKGDRVLETEPYISMQHDFSERIIAEVYSDFLCMYYGIIR